MPSIETQTNDTYTVIDNLEDTAIISNIRQFTSKYTGKEIFIFFQ